VVQPSPRFMRWHQLASRNMALGMRFALRQIWWSKNVSGCLSISYSVFFRLSLCNLCRLLCFTPGFKRRLGCVPRFPPKLPHSIGYVEGMPKGSERYTPFWDKPIHGTPYYWLYPHVFCSISPFLSDSLNNIFPSWLVISPSNPRFHHIQSYTYIYMIIYIYVYVIIPMNPHEIPLYHMFFLVYIPFRWCYFLSPSDLWPSRCCTPGHGLGSRGTKQQLWYEMGILWKKTL
jgi:hypothetical protein